MLSFTKIVENKKLGYYLIKATIFLFFFRTSVKNKNVNVSTKAPLVGKLFF